MKNLDEYFYCLRDYPDLEKEYIDQGLNAEYEQVQKPFMICAGSNISNSHVNSFLKSHFGKVLSRWILFPPKSNYDWHVDVFGRNTAIIIPISLPGEASTYCREPTFPNRKTLWYDIEKVEYVINKPTVLNIRKEHCVFNPTEEKRIILSISLEQDYAEVVNKLRV